jgi:immunoglobulin-binding protein 1
MTEPPINMEIDDEDSLSDKFKKTEAVISELADGTQTISKEMLEETVKTLKSLKAIIERMNLISSNEMIDDIPTSSLQFLLVDAFLAAAIENLSVPIDRRAFALQESQKLYNDFLLNSDIFGYNPLPSATFQKDNDEAPSLLKDTQLRQRKLDVLNMQDKLKEDIGILGAEVNRSNDESSQREMSMKKLQLWCIHSITNLEQISRELKILEHRSQHPGEDQPDPNEKKRPLNTFVIPKLEEKKKVFGMGYPGVPKQTVNEWYDQKVDSGHFPGPSTKPQTTQVIKEDDDENVNEDEELDDEEARKKRIAKDEYLDSHRRGWGNMHGKG